MLLTGRWSGGEYLTERIYFVGEDLLKFCEIGNRHRSKKFLLLTAILRSNEGE